MARPRWITRRRCVAAVLLLGVAVLATAWFARYTAARWGVGRALAAAGLTPSTFEVRSVGLSSIRIANLSITSPAGLAASELDVSYSLAGLFDRRVRDIDIRGGTWTVSLDEAALAPLPGRGTLASLDLPFDRLTLAGSTVRLVVDGTPHDLPVSGTIYPAGPGALTARLDMPVPVRWETPAMTVLLDSAAMNATVRADGERLTLTEGAITVTGGSIRAGDLLLTDAHVAAVIRSPNTAQVTTFRAIVGDGTVVHAAPFTVNLREPRARMRVTLTDLSLADWLPILTGDHARGQGRVSGHADIAMDWTGDRPRVTELSGSFSADPSHGYIQVTAAEALADLLERQDPRFATDTNMRAVRDKVVAAMQDFAFTRLTVDLSRTGRRTIALTRLSGAGRHGEDPQAINLTLDLQAEDAFLDLASRLALQSKIRNAAADALDRFFADTPAPGSVPGPAPGR